MIDQILIICTIHSPKGGLGTPVQYLINAIIINQSHGSYFNA